MVWLAPREDHRLAYLGCRLGPKDRCKIFVDGFEVLDAKTWWGDASQERKGEPIYLHAGELVPIYLNYLQEDGTARINLWWEQPDQPREVVPTEVLYSTVK